MRGSTTARLFLRVAILEAVLALPLVVPGVAQAATSCGTSNGHTLCVTAPDTALTGPTPITVTNNANNGTVIATWIPTSKPGLTLITKIMPSPETNDYSFVWPTQKYLDASGVLRVQAGSAGSSPVDVPVTLSNGNVSDFQHSPNDWANYLPNPSWTASRDPVIAAVGDGASDEPLANDNAQKIAASNPDLFLYLGDIYQDGTFTEDLNHYGQNSIDGGPGTLWGLMGTITQPAMGDHEAANRVAWQDYFHGRPLYMSFRLGNVLFLDLASAGVPMGVGSAQYNWVKSILTSTTNPPPACVVAYFQNPALIRDTIKTANGRADMWALLTDNGGDLVFNGNWHVMTQYKPLNDQLQLPSAGQPTAVELVAGSGGHAMGGTYTADPRVDWSKGGTPGAVWLTLTGAASGGTPTGLSWAYKDRNGNVLHTGTRDCGGGPPPPPAPSITGFSPTSGPVGTSVTINGSGFTGASDVKFNGTSVGSGFAVNNDSQITATVPSGATTGPISVTAPGGTATSSGNFTVTSRTALAVSLLDNGGGTASSSSPRSTNAVSPTTSVVFLAVKTRVTGASTLSGVSGLGCIWSAIGTAAQGNQTMNLWVGTGCSGSGAITYTPASSSSTNTGYAVFEVTGGINTSTPYVSSNTKTASGSSVTSLNVTPNALASSNNLYLVVVNHNVAESTTASQGMVFVNDTAKQDRIAGSYQVGWTSGGMGGSWNTAGAATIVGIEVSAT